MPNDSDNNMLNFLPPGYKFCPTDKELIKYYLKKKVLNLPLLPNKIKDVNIYKYNPQQLSDTFKEPGEERMYFFTSRRRKYRNGSRPDRVADNGYWKASGAFKPVGKKKKNGNPTGYKRSLVYYQGLHKEHPKKTDWLMSEYTIDEIASITPNDDMKLDDWVLSVVYKTLRKSQKGQMEDAEASFIIKYAALINEILEPDWPLMQLEPIRSVPELPHTPHSDAMPCAGSPTTGHNRQYALSIPHPLDAMPSAGSEMIGYNRPCPVSIPQPADSMPNAGFPMTGCNGQYAVSVPQPADSMPSAGSPMIGDNRQDAVSLPHAAGAISPTSSSQMLGNQRQNCISMPETNQDSVVQNTGQDYNSIWPTDEEINKVYHCNMPNHSSLSLLYEEEDFKYDFSMPDQSGF